MHDIECPYCGAELEINHDDGCGYAEDEKHEQQCSRCEKSFVFTTTISFSYDVEKAPCLNGGAHDMKPVVHYPRCYPEWKRCSCCSHEVRGALVWPDVAPTPVK